ncbi:MAG: type III glutamate--ammonia ligase [Burkholderiales bacterium]
MSISPSLQKQIDAARKKLAAQGVQFVMAQFTDIFGAAKGKNIPLSHLEDIFSPGAGFAGPSIWGTALPRFGANSEYYGRADLSTLQAMPWLPGYARIVCDGFVNGEPFDLCPRQILNKQVARLAERGWTLNAGLEPEFFLLHKSGDDILPADIDDVLEKPSYDYKTLMRQREYAERLTLALQQCGFDVFQIDHEDAQGQFELNYHYSDALQAADRYMLFKMAAHSIAEQMGMIFSVMPKPFAHMPGSGLHFHLSLSDKKDRPVFASNQDKRGLNLSETAYHFLGGLLRHAPALCAFSAPTVNSYKRLVVGESLSGTTWAPAYVCYGDNNRTALVRTTASRMEWRLPDSAANPYLALASLIAAGLDGIDNKINPGEPINDDLYEWSPQQFVKAGINTLPQNLGEAVTALRKDKIISKAVGEEFVAEFTRLKQIEWVTYSRHVSQWEIERYVDSM